MNSTVKAKCRCCGNSAPAEQFKLHHTLKMMVCPNCFSGKTQKEREQQNKNKDKPKPAGWDMEDDYLENYHRLKQKEKPQFKKIPGSDHLECSCRNCKYSFKYDPFKRRPRTCPFCNEEIPGLDTFSLL